MENDIELQGIFQQAYTLSPSWLDRRHLNIHISYLCVCIYIYIQLGS